MPEVPRQRGPAATARTGLQLGYLTALLRLARGNGRLVVAQPAVQDEQFGARVVRHARAITFQLAEMNVTGLMVRAILVAIRRVRATTMRMSKIQAQIERKRQDTPARRAGKRSRQTSTLRVYGLIRPTPSVCATTDAAHGGKRLISWRNQAILR